MQLLISKCSQANGKWIDQFTWKWALGVRSAELGVKSFVYPLIPHAHFPFPKFSI
jgi:hypothetical protein